MLELQLNIDKGQIENATAALAEFPKEVPAVLNRALNRTAVSVRAELVRKYRSEMQEAKKAKSVRDRIKIYKSTIHYLRVKIWISDYGFDAIEADPRKKGLIDYFYKNRKKLNNEEVPAERVFKNTGGWRGSKVEGLFARFPDSLLIKTRGKTVYDRYERNRYPTDWIVTQSLADFFRKQDYGGYVDIDATEKMEKNVKSQVDYVLAKRLGR